VCRPAPDTYFRGLFYLGRRWSMGFDELVNSVIKSFRSIIVGMELYMYPWNDGIG
jgi:hypothetical protein